MNEHRERPPLWRMATCAALLALLFAVQPADAARKLDVVFAFDATGSMETEIGVVKANSLQIMQQIADLAPDSDVAFGVVSMVDYPHYYNSYGYAGYYGDSGDYAYRTDLNITTDRDAVASVINGIHTYYGWDGPQDYARTLWELTQPYDADSEWGITWRPGARRIVVLFGDAAAHDADFFSRSYGGDPGRDEEMFTGDDLDYESVVAQVGGAGISVMTVDSSNTDPGADPWLNFEYIAKQTGGVHYVLDDASEIPSAIVSMIGDTSYDVAVRNPYDNGFDWQKECQLHCHFRTDLALGSWWIFDVGLKPPVLGENWDDWNSDVKHPAAEKVRYVESLYADRGYSYVCVTEHNEVAPQPDNWVTNHVSYCEEVTADKQPDPDDADAWLPEAVIPGFHMLSIGRSDAGALDRYPDPAEKWDEFRRRTGVEICKAGGVPVAAHPKVKVPRHSDWEHSWSLAQMNLLARRRTGSLDGVCMEIWNSSVSWVPFQDPYALDLWDVLLRHRLPVWGVGTDDYTPNILQIGLDEGCIRILTATDATNQADFIHCLRSGSFYATQGSLGPKFTSISVDEDNHKISVATDRRCWISFIGGAGGKDAPLAVGSHLIPITEASYEYDGSEGYVRIEAEDINGFQSWSQPISIDRMIAKRCTLNSPATIIVGDGQLDVDGPAGTNVDGSTVATEDLPAVAPPSGYFGDVYYFAADKTLTSIDLTVTYRESEITGVKPSRLALYQYDEDTSAWIELASTVNTTFRTVSASPASLGLFALSAKDEADDTAPTVAFTAPADGATINAVAAATVLTTDDNGAIEVVFSLDGTPFATDTFAADGWSTILDPGLMTSGGHTLKATAADAAGNVGEDEITINVPVAQAADAPTVTITAPADGSAGLGTVTISGTATAASSINVTVLCDDTVAGRATVDGGTLDWTFALDTTALSNGARTITVRATDTMGATGEATITLNVNNVPPFNVTWRSTLDLPPTLPIGPCSMSILDMRGKAVANINSPAVTFGTTVRLTNAGDTAWAAGDVIITYRWKNGAGVTVLQGSQPIADAVNPGQTIAPYIRFAAPTTAGTYTLELSADSVIGGVDQNALPTDTAQVSPTAAVSLSSVAVSPNPFVSGSGRMAGFYGRVAKSATDVLLGQWNGRQSNGAYAKNGVYRAAGTFHRSKISVGFATFGGK